MNKNKHKHILYSSPTACLCSCVTVHFNLSGQTQPMYLTHELATGRSQVRGPGYIPGKIFEIADARMHVNEFQRYFRLKYPDLFLKAS
jgi:hypothetical protein